jgi:signal peptidase I
VTALRGPAWIGSGARCALLLLFALAVPAVAGCGESGSVPATVTVSAAGHAATTATAASAAATGASSAKGASTSGASTKGASSNGAATGTASTAAAAARSSNGSASHTSSTGSTHAADASAPNAETGIPFPVRTASMEPTYQPGTTVYYDPARTTPRIGEVIVFHPPAGIKGGRCGAKETGNPCAAPVPGFSSGLTIKRVVGLPGDTIAIHSGRVFRNGRPEHEAPTIHCGVVAGCDFSKSIVVPAGEYFVMSDYRELFEEDSRVFGPVPQAAIIGIVEGS